MNESMARDNLVQYNIHAHDWVANRYATIHGEIYNEVEQKRLHEELKQALQLVDTTGNPKRVMDFGCGAGNLTAHLLSLGTSVLAADVSPEFLKNILKRFEGSNLATLKLNGINLNNIESNSLDMVATYSVLHHVPDYLSIISELMRVLKPGGILYIDHEVPEEYWTNRAELSTFYKHAKRNDSQYLKKYLHWTNYVDFFVRKFINPRYRREGDIHVFEDDHIEWSKIRSVVQGSGTILVERDYLLYRSGYREDCYETHKDLLSDMKVGIYKKNGMGTM